MNTHIIERKDNPFYQPEVYTIEDLYQRQQNRLPLTRAEKRRIQQYAEKRRIQNLNRKKS